MQSMTVELHVDHENTMMQLEFKHKNLKLINKNLSMTKAMMLWQNNRTRSKQF